MNSLWFSVRRVLKQTLDTEQFSQWIEPLKSTTLPSGDLMLETPSRFHYDWIQEHYLSLIQSCCHTIDSDLRVHIELPYDRRQPSRTRRPYIGHVPLTTRFQASKTFDTFVVAQFNRFAFVAAQDVSRDSAPKFNPLFVEGPPGLGKTHLLLAIGSAWSENREDTAVYLSCRNVIAHGSSAPPASFDIMRESLDRLGMLLVDDVHLLAERSGFLQHLREIIDRCYDSETQMVITANCLPHQIPDLPMGLRSRLGRGLIARIREPDPEGYYQIIESFFDKAETPISTDDCQYLVEQGPLNFHEIKDYAKKLQETARSEGNLPNLTERSLAIHSNSSARQERLSIQSIQKEVCVAYSVSPRALPGAAKSRPLVLARQVGMYLSRKLTGSTYASIGNAFGGRDHSTVIYACRKVRAEIRRNRGFAERIVEIEKKLSGTIKEEYPVKFET